MFEIGTFLKLTDGTNKFISNQDNAHSVTMKTANKLYEAGKIEMATVCIEGDEVYLPIAEYVDMQSK